MWMRSICARVALGCVALALVSQAFGQQPVAKPPSVPIDVYLIAGQSNAAGQGIVANLQSSQLADPRVWLYHSAHQKSSGEPFTWAPLRPASDLIGKIGPEVSFGNRMQERTPTRPVALIKHSATATTLAVDWNPGKDTADVAKWGFHYQMFVGTVDGGLKSLRDRGFEPTIRGMVWQQGESDTFEANWADAYAANLSHFIARVREQFQAPEMVFVYGFVMPPPCHSSGRDAVRTAQGAIDQDSGSPFAVKKAFVVFTDDLPTRAQEPNTTDPTDGVHLGTAGVWELGRRMAETMINKGKTCP